MSLTGEITYFVLVLARMSGCVFFNQIFGRGNLPAMFRVSLSLLFAITVYGIVPPPAQDMVIGTIIEYGIIVIKEIFIGYVIGYIISSFFAIVIIGGEIIDMQIGLSMSKIYDPKSNISMGISGSILNALMILLFFSARGHLSLVQIFMTSCKLIPIGEFTIPKELFIDMAGLLSQILVYGLKIAMPIMAVELIAEMGLGIMMKAIPQIQIFAVNIQIKVTIGVVLILFLVPSYAVFIENILTVMFQMIEKSLSVMV